MALLSPEGRWLKVNRALCEILGYSEEELLLKTFQELTHPDDLGKNLADAERLRGGEISCMRADKRYLHRDGDVVWTRLTTSFVRSPKGVPLYYISQIENISDQRRAEDEIRALNADLERRVADRTAGLQVANTELEAFASSVSHDLRTPLWHTQAYARMLRESATKTLDETSLKHLNMIDASVQRMRTMIDDLLSFARMRRCEMDYTQVELGALIQSVIRELETETAGRNVDWRVAKFPDVAGDLAMLRLAIVNLLSNALKFTRPRERAEIKIGWAPGAGGETVVFVRDNGVGFDMKNVERLWGLFRRLHGSDQFEGTGVGLANVRRIVERHGGRTWAEAKPGEGACFFFTLPPPK